MIARKSFLEQSSQRISRLSSASRHDSLINDREWEWPFLRRQCKNLGLEKFYRSYTERLRNGYLKLFIVMELLLTSVHCTVLLSTISNLNSVAIDIFADIITALLVWGLLALNFHENLIRHHSWLKYVTFCLAVAILAIVEIGVIVYHAVASSDLLTPFFDSYILYAIYMLMPLSDNLHTFILGIAVTVLYLFNYAFVTYRTLTHSTKTLHVGKVVSEGIFLMSINFLGIFFRLIREDAIRMTFMDRLKYVEESLALRYAREEEQRLLLNIIPAHIVDELEHHIKSRLQYEVSLRRPTSWKICQRRASENRKLYSRQLEHEKLFIEAHENVTILYADLVNYTHLTTSLDVKTLVETLHDLFVKFDAVSEANNVLRIKFLGDCYYAVAGVSIPNENHAKSCIELGLRMITIIRDVRKRRKLNIDMRIGVHTGSILSGVIGARKLQYDIWSKDVDIASRLESTGIAGRVHISQRTLKLLKGEYRYQVGTRLARRDPLLIKFGIRTFLIKTLKHIGYSEQKRSLTSTDSETGLYFQPDTSLHFMQNYVGEFHDIQLQAELEMSRELDKMPIGRIQVTTCCFDCTRRLSIDHLEEEHTTSLCLFFEEWHCEMQFLADTDDMLKYSVLMGLVIFIVITAMNLINKLQYKIFWISHTIFMVLFITVLFLTWFKKLWVMIFSRDLQLKPNNYFALSLFNVSKQIQNSITARITIYLLTVAINFSASFIQLLDCQLINSVSEGKNVQHLTKWQDVEVCFNPWGITESLILTICMVFIFPRIPFFVKFAAGIIISATYSIIIFVSYSKVYEAGPSTNIALEAKYSHIMVIILTFIIFYLMDRQTEFVTKVDYNLKHQLLRKQEDAEITNAYIKMLVNNILPSHVADIYILKQMTKELYYEEYDDVAVMFACIKNYDIETLGLTILNDIICHFDEVVQLFEAEGVYKVEKIKVAGWNYIAACGLDIARSKDDCPHGVQSFSNSNFSNQYISNNIKQDMDPNTSSKRSHFVNFPQNYTLLVMTRFALQLMKAINCFSVFNQQIVNEDASQGMLRIGISNGPIMAGVIGSSKPHYDIWGDCVNMASRMAFTGMVGHIQVTKDAAEVLRTFNVLCNYRDMTYVKGRGKIPTYFVAVDKNFDFIRESKSTTGSDST